MEPRSMELIERIKFMGENVGSFLLIDDTNVRMGDSYYRANTDLDMFYGRAEGDEKRLETFLTRLPVNHRALQVTFTNDSLFCIPIRLTDDAKGSLPLHTLGRLTWYTWGQLC